MPIVVNLFASPGSGKSTTASGVFYSLKNLGINAELTGEYAKDLTWAKRHHTLLDQLYVFGKQHHRVWRLKDDVDVIISDSPILMALAYASGYPDCFKETVKWAFDRYDNMNFVVRRVKPYNPKGRSQTETQSNEKHLEIRNLLFDMNVDFFDIDGNFEGVDFIVQQVLKKLSTVEKTC